MTKDVSTRGVSPSVGSWMNRSSSYETKWLHYCFSNHFKLMFFYQDFIVYSGVEHLNNWCHCISYAVALLSQCTFVWNHLTFCFSLQMHFFLCFAFILLVSKRVVQLSTVVSSAWLYLLCIGLFSFFACYWTLDKEKQTFTCLGNCLL